MCFVWGSMWAGGVVSKLAIVFFRKIGLFLRKNGPFLKENRLVFDVVKDFFSCKNCSI